MFYKRKETFRYTFGDPLEASFRMIRNENGKAVYSNKGRCLLIDISPGGLRIFSELSLPIGAPMEVQFMLSHDPIVVAGTAVWRKPYMSGSLYGVDLLENPVTEQQIIEELKGYRRAEVERQKKR